MRTVDLLIGVAVASALSAGCEQSGISITYLRSAAYTFSSADRRAIGRIADSTAVEVRRLLPQLPTQIEITVRPGSDVIPETGETATAVPPASVVWTVDPTREGGVAAVTNQWLRASLFHEFHHLVRAATASPESIVDHAVFEGIATVFERDFAGVVPPWGAYPADVNEWAKELQNLPADAPVKDWIYRHPDGRRWIGMRVGAYWIDRAMAKSGQSSAALVAAPTSRILSLAAGAP